MTTEKLLSAADLRFLLHDWLGIAALAERPRFAEGGPEAWDAVLETCAVIAAARFKPLNKLVDRDEPRFEAGRVVMRPEVAGALAAFREAGMFGAGAAAELGGLQLPAVVTAAGMAWFEAASVAISAYAFLTVGAANLLAAFGSPAQIDRYVRPMVAGRFFGTMALSEPQAGSSLADIRTRAVPQPDGSYRVFGTKMWISGGDHELADNIVHMVLARIEGAPPGIAGLSLFVVPRHHVSDDGAIGARNDIALAGLNHKMGYRGATNTLLNFGERGEGAHGELVGKAGRGLAAMFHMMNEARIAVGRGAVALGYTGYLHALDYARQRPQGRPPGRTRDASMPPVAIIRHADVRRMLLAQKCYAEGGLALILFCARLVDEQATGTPDAVAEAGRLLDILTPVAKAWPSQWCLHANDLAIQVHGGYGYTRDYDVEQFYRDNRLNPIHEGTNGIQAIDLLGRKVAVDGGRNLVALRARIDVTCRRARDAGGEAATFAGALGATFDELEGTACVLHAADDPEVTLANAQAYLESFGHAVIAWLWLEQLLAIGARADDFACGKRQACRFFFRHELPRTEPLLALLRTRDTTALEMQEDWF